MGIYVLISEESLVRCPQAKCRAFRPGFPAPALLIELLEYMPSDATKRTRRVLPIESLPLPIVVSGGQVIEPETGTEEKYAVDVTVEWIDWENDRRQVKFNRWLSRNEYNEIRPQYEERVGWFWKAGYSQLTYREQQEICDACLLQIPDAWHCHPRLFGYPDIPYLRKTVAELFEAPPDAVRVKVEALLRDFSSALEKHAVGDRETSKAAKHEQRARLVSDEIIRRGGKIIVGEMPPPAPIAPIADLILDGLFSSSEEEEWFSRERLEHLVGWLEKLLEIMSEMRKKSKPSKAMGYLYEVMDTYAAVCRQALKYGLEICVSW